MNSSKPFGFWLDRGATKEELMWYYVLSPGQYDNVVRCLQDLKKNGGKKT